MAGRNDAVAAFGRGVLVWDGLATPEPWVGAPRIRIDDAALRQPRKVADVLHRHWAHRLPVVVEIAVDAEELRQEESDVRAPYELPRDFEFSRERLYAIARANNYQFVGDALVWGLALEAARLGATIGGPADVVLADGTAVWCDGGPRRGATPPSEYPVLHRVRIEEGHLGPDRYGAQPALDLDPTQFAAVIHDAGPARIVAPAGSGKTRVLTERFRLLVQGRGWGHGPVTAVAYNVRAREEMQARLAGLPDAALDKIRTLHSLGHAIVTARSGRLTVIDEIGVRTRIRALINVPGRANTDVYAPYIEALASVRNALRSPQAVEESRDDVPGFAAFFDRYRDDLASSKAIDHDEQIYSAVETLLRRPDIRREFQRRCRHLLVDEFQDLTPAQLLLVRLLAAPTYDVFGVGDDDQVIYGYAGADPGFLVNYDQYFPEAAVHSLEVNYRCPPGVVDAALKLLSHNRGRVDKTIRAAKPDTGKPAGLIRRTSADGLASAAVDQITRWLEGGSSPDQIAVLARANSALLPVQVLCMQHGIPCNAAFPARQLERIGTQAAFAYLRLAVALADGGPLSSADVSTTLRRPPRAVPQPTHQHIGGRTHWTWEELRDLSARQQGRTADRLADYLAALAALGHAARSADTATLLRAARDDIGLGTALAELDASGRGPEASHRDQLNALIAIAAQYPEPRTFEAWLRTQLDSQQADLAVPHVLLSSVHRQKGREWPHVIVLGAHEGLMPHSLADDIEEERRIFHVAITRCTHDLVILAERERSSPFVDEMREAAVTVAGAGPAGRKMQRPPSAVEASIDLIIDYVGTRSRIVDLEPSAAVIHNEYGVELRVPYGARVKVDGRLVRLLVPAGIVAQEDFLASIVRAGPPDGLVEALKQWRLERARTDGEAAVDVILTDRQLSDIARRRPSDLHWLRKCKGMGPTRLERYGDEILAVVASWADHWS